MTAGDDPHDLPELAEIVSDLGEMHTARRLARHFLAIRDRQVRARLLKLFKATANADTDASHPS
jgi:16S rRNA C1402 N4-methylase RsmH